MSREKTKQTKRERRSFTAMEKCQAVLSIWSERRTMQGACEELAITYTQLAKWQSVALEAMVAALSPKETDRALPPMLSDKLEKLLVKKVNKGSGDNLTKRLNAVQKSRSA
jgi:transposase-like protein